MSRNGSAQQEYFIFLIVFRVGSGPNWQIAIRIGAADVHGFSRDFFWWEFYPVTSPVPTERARSGDANKNSKKHFKIFSWRSVIGDDDAGDRSVHLDGLSNLSDGK
jgi:hypothetical protein